MKESSRLRLLCSAGVLLAIGALPRSRRAFKWRSLGVRLFIQVTAALILPATEAGRWDIGEERCSRGVMRQMEDGQSAGMMGPPAPAN